MSPPRVSVILNSYNQAEYLAATIESVLAQTFGDFELLYIDNGSTDGSPEIARSFCTDARLRLVLHTQNATLSRRQNEGVALARGEFVSFLYSDDLYLPHKLERQLGLFAGLSDDYAVVYARPIGWNVLTGQRWVHQGLRRSGFILPTIFAEAERWIDMLSPLTRRAALVRYPFYEDLFAEGEAVFQRIAMTQKFHYDDEAVVILREHGRNLSKAARPNHENYMRVLERMEQHPDFPVELRPLLEPFRAELQRNVAWQLLRMGDPDVAWARSRLVDSMLRDPRHAMHPRAIAALALSLLPARLRAWANRVGFLLRPSKGNVVLRSDYT